MKATEYKALMSELSAGLAAEDIACAAMTAGVSAVISIKRQELGMNQKEFAEYMGVSQGMVSRWESGTVNLTLRALARIAVKLDIPLQSPFITNDAPRYVTHGNKVVDFSAWRGTVSGAPKYGSPEYKEM